MIQSIINFFRPRPAIAELPLDLILDSVREAMDEPAKPARRKYKKRRPMQHQLLDLEVGATYRVAKIDRHRTHMAAIRHARESGKQFKVTNAANGVWVRRLA